MDQEQEWILRARAGDVEAFTKLVEAYQTPVYNLAYRMLGNSVEAEDAAQETFIRVYTRLHTYDEDRKFSFYSVALLHRSTAAAADDIALSGGRSFHWPPGL